MTFTDSIEAIVATNHNGLLARHESWQRVPLGLVCRVVNGFPFPSNRFSSERGTPLIRIRDVLAGTTETRFDGEYEPQYVVSRGELLVGMDGDFNCAPWRGEPALLNQRVCKVVPDERHYSVRFLKYTIQGYLSAIHARTPSMTVKHLSSRTLADCPLPLPPRGEQERVADSLDEMLGDLDSAAAALERVQRNLKRYRAAVLQAAVEGRLVPAEAELARAEGRDYEPASELLKRILAERRRRWEEAELARLNAGGKTPKDDKWKAKYNEPAVPDPIGLPDLPEGWSWASLDQLTADLEGGTAETASDTPSKRRVLRSSAVRQGRVDLTDLRYLPDTTAEPRFIHPGELLITRLSGSLEYVGNCGVVPDVELGGLEFPDRLFRARLSSYASSRYVQHCFAVSHLRRPLERTAKSTAGHQRISLSDLRPFAIPLPPLSEQTRITDEIESQLGIADEVALSLDHNRRRSARLRQAILKWAFEGKLVDQDPDDEPASVLLERIRAERAAKGPADPLRGAKKKRQAHQGNS